MHFIKKSHIASASLRVIVVMGLLLFSITGLMCQEKNVKSDYEKEFEEFKKAIEGEFLEFKSKNGTKNV